MTITDTSLNPYLLEVEPTLGDRHKKVLQAFKERGELTNSELAAHLDWSINRVTPRVFELRKKGLISRSSMRPCKVTGRSATVWSLSVNPEQKVMGF